MSEIPNNREAESACIGSVLINPDAYREMAQYITADDFYTIRNQWIFNAIEEMFREHIEVDIITLSEKLNAAGKLKEIGGKAYLMQLQGDTPTSMHAEHYAKIVQDDSKRRNMIKAASELAKNAYDPDSEIDEVVPEHITQVLSSLKTSSKTEHISAGLCKLLDDIEYRVDNKNEVYGIPTGLPSFDRQTGGVQKSEILMLSGEPGLGKSLLANQWVFNMAKNGRPGVIYNLEMGQVNSLRRTLSNEARVQARAMKSGYIEDGDWPKIINGIEVLEKLPIYLSNNTSWTTASIRADVTRLQQEKGIEWFMIDYLGKLKDKYNGKDFERIGVMGSALHDTAVDLDIAGIVIHTMVKSGYNATPGMEALGGTALVGYDPDVALFLTRAEENRHNKGQEIMNLSFGKFREGAGKTIQLKKEKYFPLFREVSDSPYPGVKLT